MTSAAAPATGHLATRSARAMGCRATIAVDAEAGDVDHLLESALGHLGHLERRWSRFLDDSDISRLNRAAGATVDVDPSTIRLLVEMGAAVRATDGRFDPTLLSGPSGLGPAGAWCRRPIAAAGTTRGAWWIDETFVDVEQSRVGIPAGVQLDAGAIGKGLAADLVSERLHEAGVSGVRVVVGGDLRATLPTVVDVNDPDWSGPIDRIALDAGGVATSGISSTATLPTPSACRVLDPRTRRPLTSTGATDVVQVTVAADSAAHAEAWATAVLVDPSAVRAITGEPVALLVVHADGSTVANDAWRALRGGRMVPGGR